LKLGKALHVGLRQWYIITGPKANIVLKVRDGIVQELRIVVRQLTDGRAAQRRLLTSYRVQ
jgi:hypothetical protein